jgi:hypothetical protein
MDITGGTMKLIVELKAGIDPTESELISTPDNYWELDGTAIRLTNKNETIAGNLWQLDGTALKLDDAGTIALYWELDGTALKLKE